MEHSLFVGIDVAKDRLDVHVRPTDEVFSLEPTETGLGSLVARLRGLTPALIVLEATGGYEVTVAVALAEAGLPLVVANLRQIRDFARALGQLAKTDTLDARAIGIGSCRGASRLTSGGWSGRCRIWSMISGT